MGKNEFQTSKAFVKVRQIKKNDWCWYQIGAFPEGPEPLFLIFILFSIILTRLNVWRILNLLTKNYHKSIRNNIWRNFPPQCTNFALINGIIQNCLKNGCQRKKVTILIVNFCHPAPVHWSFLEKNRLLDRQRLTYGLRQRILRWTEPDKRDEKKHQQKQEKERKDKTKISTTLDPHSITFPWLEPLWLQAPDERLIL